MVLLPHNKHRIPEVFKIFHNLAAPKLIMTIKKRMYLQLFIYHMAFQDTIKQKCMI